MSIPHKHGKQTKLRCSESQKDRAKAKAELQKLKAFYAFMFNKDPKQVLEFEWLHLASSGEQSKEEAEAPVAEAVLNFDLSTLQK